MYVLLSATGRHRQDKSLLKKCIASFHVVVIWNKNATHYHDYNKIYWCTVWNDVSSLQSEDDIF